LIKKEAKSISYIILSQAVKLPNDFAAIHESIKATRDYLYFYNSKPFNYPVFIQEVKCDGLQTKVLMFSLVMVRNIVV